MTALTCPVCSGSMREVSRNDVTIDTCTKCRGVWLDRGELDKLLAGIRPELHRHQSYDRDDDSDRYEHGHPRKKRSKMESFMDIFD